MKIITNPQSAYEIIPERNNFILNFGLTTDLGSLAQFIVCRKIITVSDNFSNDILRNYINYIIPDFNKMEKNFICNDISLNFQISILEKRLEPIINKSFNTNNTDVLLQRIENSIKRCITYINNDLNSDMALTQLKSLEGVIAFYEQIITNK